jgi:DNA-binding GntR family transcriptional regulator
LLLPGFRWIELNDLTPKYRQIEAHIQALISAGELGPEDQLPSQTVMASKLGCARETVHRAFEKLELDGWVKAIQGVGTFVQDRQLRPPAAPLDFKD